MAHLDTIDQQLILLLQADSSRTIKQLAAELNLTSTPIYERIKRLEKTGVIEGYRAEINAAQVGKELMIFSHVSLKEHSKEFLLNFETKIKGLTEVIECYHVSGEHDYLLKVLVANMKGYREFLTEKLAKIKNIGNVHSSFVVEEIKKDRIIDPR
ncbi:MAG: Lrp/AsnC family leucine-responsive transcriptional regulator [Crocinitomix sp.]|jgi:Lrp/AsnC family leucine-responsive transcriptional regulator